MCASGMLPAARSSHHGGKGDQSAGYYDRLAGPEGSGRTRLGRPRGIGQDTPWQHTRGRAGRVLAARAEQLSCRQSWRLCAAQGHCTCTIFDPSSDHCFFDIHILLTVTPYPHQRTACILVQLDGHSRQCPGRRAARTRRVGASQRQPEGGWRVGLQRRSKEGVGGQGPRTVGTSRGRQESSRRSRR